MHLRLVTFVAAGMAACLQGAPRPASAQGAPQAAVVFSLDDSRSRCIVSRPSPDGGFAVLAVGPCADPAAQFVVDEAGRRVRPASNRALCFSDATGAGAAPFGALLRECADDTSGQFYAWNGRNGRFQPHDATTAPDEFCYYTGRQRGGMTLIEANLCNLPNVRRNTNAFTMLPGRE